MTQVSWSNDRGGSGTATGTTSWSVSGIVLLSGQNVLTVTARDAAGNTSTDTLTVTYTPPDSTLPTVTITTPTSAATHTASATPLSLGGTASDNVAVTQVSWSNDRGGSGTATGTTSWSVSGIVLLSGQNVLTVTASDAAGNTSTDTLTVTYTPPDTTLPTVTITAPTSAATHSRERDAAEPGGHGLGQRGGDAGQLEQRSGRQWHGDRHDELVGERDRAAERAERADGDGARCGGQHQHRYADGDLHPAGQHAARR